MTSERVLTIVYRALERTRETYSTAAEWSDEEDDTGEAFQEGALAAVDRMRIELESMLSDESDREARRCELWRR